jgi:hypothetical protein
VRHVAGCRGWNAFGVCAVKGVDFQWVRIPPGNLVILAGSSSGDSGGDERVEALNEKDRQAIQRVIGP